MVRLVNILLVAGTIGWLCLPSVRASEVAPNSGTNDEIDPNADITHMTPSESLGLAYNTLYLANHNYNGHRAGAMREISQAANFLNLTLNGDGKGHEDQNTSDTQVKFARRLVEHARSRIPDGPDRQSIFDHLDNALKHLEQALQIRVIEDQH